VGTIQILSPVDGSVYAERPTATADAIARATSAARDAARAWRSIPLAERAIRCSAAVDAMLAMESEIVPELAWQMGRPVRYGPGELKGFEERARAMIEIAETALAPIDPGPKPGFTRSIRREPLGVVFTIAPWNYPYLTTVNSVIPALMAGNAVLLKHASQTLLVGERFAQAFERAGLPSGLFHHLVLDHDQTASIIAGGAVDGVCFTGSVPAGRALERSAAGRFVPVGLELGGKDPAYVRADANLEHAIENLADGAFFNSGQSCCGIERIYVDAHLYDDFVDGVAAAARRYVLGDPLDPATTLGPLVKSSAAQFVRGQIGDAVAAGARTHVDASGFDRDSAGSPYMAPQVLTGVNHEMRIMTEETFGPVVGIMKVHSDEEAIRLMNDSDFGLTAAIWTEDEAAALAIGERLETGTVFMNRCDYLDPALAWTGVKDTGRGCTLSALGYEALTRPKSFHLRTSTA
jgi:acyl-CoA reductase-like NAD-dependent aldehyde dehydrogenase